MVSRLFLKMMRTRVIWNNSIWIHFDFVHSFVDSSTAFASNSPSNSSSWAFHRYHPSTDPRFPPSSLCSLQSRLLFASSDWSLSSSSFPAPPIASLAARAPNRPSESRETLWEFLLFLLQIRKISPPWAFHQRILSILPQNFPQSFPRVG